MSTSTNYLIRQPKSLGYCITLGRAHILAQSEPDHASSASTEAAWSGWVRRLEWGEPSRSLTAGKPSI